MDKCFFCKGSMVESTTNYMADLGGYFIIIRNVPCHKCTQCGEVVVQIEKIIEKLKGALTEVSVEYAA